MAEKAIMAQGQTAEALGGLNQVSHSGSGSKLASQGPRDAEPL